MHAVLKITSDAASPDFQRAFFTAMENRAIGVMLDCVRVARDALRDECHFTDLDQAVSDADIQAVGIKPNPTDRAECRARIAERKDRMRPVSAFLADAQLYRTELLGG